MTSQTSEPSLTWNLMCFDDRRVINVTGPDYRVQFDMLPGETEQQALRRHYLEVDRRIDRLSRQRRRIVDTLSTMD